MKKVPVPRWLLYGIRLILAIAFPPFYFLIRKRWKVAIILSILMVALAKWNGYVLAFAVLLAVVGEIVQIITDLKYEVGEDAANKPTFLRRPTVKSETGKRTVY